MQFKEQSTKNIVFDEFCKFLERCLLVNFRILIHFDRKLETDGQQAFQYVQFASFLWFGYENWS